VTTGWDRANAVARWVSGRPASAASLVSSRTPPLPGFYIGAHAAVSGYRLLTRDVTRFRGYFPSVELIAPA
jgi:predicted nucleic acid-binding protein